MPPGFPHGAVSSQPEEFRTKSDNLKGDNPHCSLTEALQPVWDAKLGLTAVKKASQVPLPHDAEGLRYRLSLWGTAWTLAGLQQTSCT